MAESESTEMYLKTILELEDQGEPIAISRMAERLGVSAVSANEMVKRLVERELVVHIPYKGVHLTEKGGQRARAVLRRHRLWERFLVDHLGIAWELAHDPACQLEHATTDEIAEALAGYLDYPKTCPHGNPIPTAEGKLDEVPAIPLNEMEVGQSGRVARIHPEELMLLTYLAEKGIYPDLPILVEDIAPYNGPLTLLIDGKSVILGREIAQRIMIEVKKSGD